MVRQEVEQGGGELCGPSALSKKDRVIVRYRKKLSQIC